MRHLILLTVFASGTLLADPVLSFSGSTAPANAFNQTVGWEFDVLNTITVTSLGWYDQNSDGLLLAHTVGIWDSSGNLLTSVLVAQGTTDPLVGLFRTAAITPIVLTPGTNYIVGGQEFSTDNEQLFGPASTTDSRIAFDKGEHSNADNLFELPTIPTGNPNCCWGPSFSVDAAANVPEPSGVSALLAAGVLAMLVARRTRRA
jgi:hypothetical protein